jgi:hypothetical protein
MLIEVLAVELLCTVRPTFLLEPGAMGRHGQEAYLKHI